MAEEKVSRRNEDLLEAIFEISLRKGFAQSRDISAALQITPATVTDGFKRLQDAGLVNYEPYGGVTLTETGRLIARRTQDSHQIIRKLLELAGVDADTADRDACVMEHGLSPDSCDRLNRIVAFIESCCEKPECRERYMKIVQKGEPVPDQIQTIP